MSQYNEYLYNATEFNLTNYSSNLFETETLIDSVAKSLSRTLVDSQAAVDALSDGVTMAALLDTVTIYQHAYTQLAYNNTRYGWDMYNIRFDEDEVLLMLNRLVQETMTLSDDITDATLDKGLLDSISHADFLMLMANPAFVDFIFLSEYFRIEITNKSLPEILRLNDWVRIEHRPFLEKWHD